VRPHGYFRFVNFGHPPPLVFSAEYGRFMELNKRDMVQFPALGLEIPEDHPDRNLYVSMTVRKRQMGMSDVADITLMNRGDLLFLHTDGVYDGSDENDRRLIEQVIRERKGASAKEICNAVLAWAVEKDDRLRDTAPEQIDDKTVFIIKRT
jgi:serine phosphatase RsbU (regulator of sigma subunit)